MEDYDIWSQSTLYITRGISTVGNLEKAICRTFFTRKTTEALKQRNKFLNGHACLSDNGTKEPTLEVAGMIGDRYRALSVGMLEVVV